MPLSEYEQRVLEQMERQLTSDDPRLANTLQARGRRGVARWTIAGVGFVAGLLLLVAGAAKPLLLLGVLGFLLMFASCVFGFSRPRASGPIGVVNAKGGLNARPSGQPKKAGLLSKFEQRWDKRRDEGGR